MSMTQTLIGTGALAAVLSAAIGLVIPDPPLPPAITIHELSFDGALVTQDRTVDREGDAFLIAWAAAVYDAAGNSIRWCEGDGSFGYSTGRWKATFDLADWIGNPNCTVESLPPGTYTLRAVWSWGSQEGDQQVTARSEPFEVTP